MIDKLTEQEWQTNEAIARRLNVVIEAVEALRRQFERHIAVEVGAEPVEGEDVCPKCGGSGMIYRGWGGAEYCECRRDWKKEYEDAEEAIGGLVDERDELRAERDAAQARVAELEADAALGALVRRMPPDSKLTRTIDDRWQTDAGDEWILRPEPEDALRAALEGGDDGS